MTHAQEAILNLQEAIDTLQSRDADYKDTVWMHARVLHTLLPDIQLHNPEQIRRFGILSMMIVKLTRYCANFNEGGHSDSLTDLICYTAMLAGIDDERLPSDKPLV